MRFLALILIFWCAVSSAQQPRTKGCLSAASARLARLTIEHRDHPAIYCAHECWVNAGELGRLAKAKFGRDLNDDHLHILVFKHKDYEIYGGEEAGLENAILGKAARGGTLQSWNYHAVLEYEGRIFDLDSEHEHPLPLKEYLDRMFPEDTLEVGKGAERKQIRLNHRIDLQVLEVPAHEYVTYNPERPAAEDINLDFTEFYDFEDLGPYLQTFNRRVRDSKSPSKPPSAP